MSLTRNLTSLAAGLAAGSYTNEFVLDQLGGDKSLFDRVLGMASAGVVGGIASSIVDEVAGDALDDIDDFIGDIFDF